MKQPKPFIVRTFDPDYLETCTGTIDAAPGFEEVVTESSVVATQAVVQSDTNYNHFADETGSAYSVNLSIDVDTGSARNLRSSKSEIRETLKRWAEKSRVKNIRGFRASAIKTPTYALENGSVVIRTSVIFSPVIWYNKRQAKTVRVDHAYMQADVGSLARELAKVVPYGLMTKVKYETGSQVGKFSV